MKNLISLLDLGKNGVEALIAEAEMMIPYAKSKKTYPVKLELGQVLPAAFELFLERSLRTWGSFATAAEYVGFNYRVILGEEQTSIPKGETFANTIRMLAGTQGADIIVMRTKWEGAPRFASEIVSTPIINGGDGCNRHPSQTLLDLLTIKRKLGRLSDFTLGIVGDLSHSRVAHDLLTAARLFGFRVGFISAPETRPPQVWRQGVQIVFESDEMSDLRHCDVVYILRLQKERIQDPVEIKRLIGKLQITLDLLDRICRPDVLVMHAQPIDQHDGIFRIQPHVFDDPRIIFHEQAWFGLPVRMAILANAYWNLMQPTSIPEISPVETVVHSESTVDDHFAKLTKRRGQYFKPIRSGTVIDHLSCGHGSLILSLMQKHGVKFEGPVIHAQGIDSKIMPERKKDVLVLDNTFPPEHFLAALTLFSPHATCNLVRDGVFRKIKFAIPKMIPKIFSCPNPDCICNNDPEAVSRFWSLSSEETEPVALLCAFCERVFTTQEILSLI